MLQVNPANILNMLIICFQISNIPRTPVNYKEIELRDMIKDNYTNFNGWSSFEIQTDTTLEFENYWESNLSAEFVEDVDIETLEEDDEDDDEAEGSCISEEREIVWLQKKSCWILEKWKKRTILLCNSKKSI